MKFYFIFILLFFLKFSYSQEIKDYKIGEIVTLESIVLVEHRNLNIALPDDYSIDDNVKYPVVYLLDGSTNEDFLHVVGLLQFFNLQFNMPKVIVVGIANSDRKRDFTFATNDKELKQEFPTSGGSDNFITFLEKEAIPYIESNYKTSELKFLIGQSLGGLVATEIVAKKPYLFSHYLITSPSLWWDNQSILKNVKNTFEKNNDKNCYVYLAVGGKEHPVMIKDAKSLYRILQKNPQIKIDFIVFPEENHATILHNSLYKAFSLLYPYKEN